MVTLLAALLFAAEVFNRPVLSRAFARGVSQNVVAKYEPGYSAETGGSRRRKVIVVSRYDSGKVNAELNGPLLSILPILQWATFGAMVFLPVLLIVRNVVFLNAEGATAIVLNVLACIALVLVALPLVFALLHKLASYNEGANCNAAGTAVMLEVARRVGRGRVSEAELAANADAAIHGEDAARKAGLVPEGAQLVYEAANVKPPAPAPQTPEARLAAAKAAIAALSGKPVSGVTASDIAQNLVQIKEPPLPAATDEGYRELRDETREALSSIPEDTMQEALANAEAAAAEEARRAAEEAAAIAAATAGMAASSYDAVSQAGETSNGVPDWFKKAQEKAKKPRNADKPVQRSRFASALDAADSESAGSFAEVSKPSDRGTADVSDSGSNDSLDVQAPQWHMTEASAADGSQRLSDDGDYEVPSGEEGLQAPSSAAHEAAVEDAQGDPFSTTAMPPIDVSGLRLDDMPPISDVPMPSFLDPRKVQEEARAAQADMQRSGNRVDVTGAPIGASGRIDVDIESYEVSTEEAVPQAETSAHRPIVLPDIGVSATNLPPISELPKQRAPLADVETSGKSAAKSLLSMLPSIDVSGDSTERVSGENATNASGDSVEKKHSLRSMLPSLSGSISRADASEGKLRTSAQQARSFLRERRARSRLLAMSCWIMSTLKISTSTMLMIPLTSRTSPSREPSPAPGTWKCPNRAFIVCSTVCAVRAKTKSLRLRSGLKWMSLSMLARWELSAAAGKASERMRESSIPVRQRNWIPTTRTTRTASTIRSKKTDSTALTTTRALTNTMTDTGLTSVVLGMAELSRPVVWRRLNSTSTALRTNRLNPSISMIPTSLPSSSRYTSSATPTSTRKCGSSRWVRSSLKTAVCAHSSPNISRSFAALSSSISTAWVLATSA